MSTTNDWRFFHVDQPPQDSPVEVLLRDGSRLIARVEPYWCGSDCPCDVAGEVEEPLTSPPQCWHVPGIEQLLQKWRYI